MKNTITLCLACLGLLAAPAFSQVVAPALPVAVPAGPVLTGIQPSQGLGQASPLSFGSSALPGLGLTSGIPLPRIPSPAAAGPVDMKGAGPVEDLFNRLSLSYMWRDATDPVLDARFDFDLSKEDVLKTFERLGFLPAGGYALSKPERAGYGYVWEVRILDTAREWPVFALYYNGHGEYHHMSVYGNASMAERLASMASALAAETSVKQLEASAGLYHFVASRVPAPDPSEDPAGHYAEIRHKLRYHFQQPGAIYIDFVRGVDSDAAEAVFRRHGVKGTFGYREADQPVPCYIVVPDPKAYVRLALALAREPLVIGVWPHGDHAEEINRLSGR
ncbi:MAG: hypothetical protein WC728_16705 [Elusimicrobiota bacterium]